MHNEMAAYEFAIVRKFAKRLLNVKSLELQKSGNKAKSKSANLAKRFTKSDIGIDNLSSSISRRSISLITKKIEKKDNIRVM